MQDDIERHLDDCECLSCVLEQHPPGRIAPPKIVDEDLADAERRMFIHMLDNLAESYNAKRYACGLKDHRDLNESLDTRTQILVEWWQGGGRKVLERKP